MFLLGDKAVSLTLCSETYVCMVSVGRRPPYRWVRDFVDCEVHGRRLMLSFTVSLENIFIYNISKAQLSKTNTFGDMTLVNRACFLTEFGDSSPSTWVRGFANCSAHGQRRVVCFGYDV